MPNFHSTDHHIGNILVVVATVISAIGVIFNNVFLWHIYAMVVWAFSNVLLAGFFYGQYRGFWNGGLPSVILCIFYSFCFVTGMYGLVFA